MEYAFSAALILCYIEGGGLIYKPDMMWIHPDLSTSEEFAMSPDILLIRKSNHFRTSSMYFRFMLLKVNQILKDGITTYLTDQ